MYQSVSNIYFQSCHARNTSSLYQSISNTFKVVIPEIQAHCTKVFLISTFKVVMPEIQAHCTKVFLILWLYYLHTRKLFTLVSLQTSSSSNSFKSFWCGLGYVLHLDHTIIATYRIKSAAIFQATSSCASAEILLKNSHNVTMLV